MKDKICLVVQRYGLEVNGGAELQCRLFAEHLLSRYDVEVVTTKALDYMSWKNEYSQDEEVINGVRVRRFGVDRQRKAREFNNINGKLLREGLTPEEEHEWLDKQGPLCPQLIRYIRDNKDNYKVFIFFAYLFYPTVKGLPEVAEKAIFIPEAHNEPFLKMDIIRRLFYMPRAFFFNTEEEKNFVHRKFCNSDIPYDIGGIGIEEPASADPDDFKKKFGLDNYLLYIGRIDEGKNCHILFNYFKEYKKRNGGNLKLALIGKPVIEIPKDDDIVALGFLAEQDKTNGLTGAKMLVLPSEYESLSMVVLEAMTVGTPVLVNGKCEVLKGHCIKSNGALYYTNYFEFEAEVNYLLQNQEEKEAITANARKYVDDNYKWSVVIGKLTDLIERI